MEIVFNLHSYKITNVIIGPKSYAHLLEINVTMT